MVVDGIGKGAVLIKMSWEGPVVDGGSWEQILWNREVGSGCF